MTTTPPMPTFAGADPSHSAWLARHIWAGEYDREGFVPRPGWRVVDVGANVGVFSVLSALRGAEVVAYEPHPGTYDHLVANAAPHGVVCRRAAVVAESPPDGHVALFLGDKDTRHSLHPADQGTERALTDHVDVPAVAFADVLSDGCDLLKMDCEGVEFDLLAAATAEDLRGLRRLVVELHGDPAQMDAFEARLRAEGFRTDRRPLEGGRLALCFAAREEVR